MNLYDTWSGRNTLNYRKNSISSTAVQ